MATFLHPRSDGNDANGPHHFGGVDPRCGGRESLDDEAIRQDHLAGHLPEQCCADMDDHGISVHQIGQQAAGPDDQRNADAEAEDQQHHVALRDSRYGQNVIRGHGDVRDDDEPHRFPEARPMQGRGFERWLFLKQSEGDPQDHQSAHQLENFQVEKKCREERGYYKREYSADRAAQQRPLLHRGGQRFRSRCDDNGVVSAQRQIDHDYAEDLEKEIPVQDVLEEIHGPKS